MCIKNDEFLCIFYCTSSNLNLNDIKLMVHDTSSNNTRIA